MKIHMLFASRTFDQGCEPELIASVDEYVNDDNPDYLQGEIDKVRINHGEFLSYAIITADFDEDLIKVALARNVKLQPVSVREGVTK